MGPPKKLPKAPIPIDEYRRRIDTFEYRLGSKREYYLFNPYTGETIFDVNNAGIKSRRDSMWFPPDKYPSVNAETTLLYPEYYASRRWGRRKFYGWADEVAPIIHIQAVVRGGLVRKRLRLYYRKRYDLQICKFSGYYFYFDRENPEEDTTWHKPYLAFPLDILYSAAKVIDPDDPLKGEKHSQLDFERGPYNVVKGLSKNDKARADHGHFFKPNPWRDSAINKYDDIDLEHSGVGAIVAWMDGCKGSAIEINEYHIMRAAICGNNWDRVLKIMKADPNNLLIWIYGFHSFSKMEVPLDSTGIIDFCTSDAMGLCVDVLSDKQIGQSLKTFALHAFFNILSCRPGRLEYMSIAEVNDYSENRVQAIQEFLIGKVQIFNQFLKVIPSESVAEYTKGVKTPIYVQRPLPRSIEIVEGALRCMTILAHEIDSKEPMSYTVVQPLMHAMDICQGESIIIKEGLALMYNIVYRCESAQEAVLVYCSPGPFFEVIKYNHDGDPEVMRQVRKVELALMENGWRGNVEVNITREMEGEEIPSEYLVPVDTKKKKKDEESKSSR